MIVRELSSRGAPEAAAGRGPRGRGRVLVRRVSITQEPGAIRRRAFLWCPPAVLGSVCGICPATSEATYQRPRPRGAGVHRPLRRRSPLRRLDLGRHRPHRDHCPRDPPAQGRPAPRRPRLRRPAARPLHQTGPARLSPRRTEHGPPQRRRAQPRHRRRRLAAAHRARRRSPALRARDPRRERAEGSAAPLRRAEGRALSPPRPDPPRARVGEGPRRSRSSSAARVPPDSTSCCEPGGGRCSSAASRPLPTAAPRAPCATSSARSSGPRPPS